MIEVLCTGLRTNDKRGENRDDRNFLKWTREGDDGKIILNPSLSFI